MIKYKSLFLFLTALCSFASFFLLPASVYGQWLETTITAGSNPCALVWNSQNNKVYCANMQCNNVTVIDGQTNSVITTITVGSERQAFCWNSIQNRVYVTNHYSSSISVIRDVMPGIEEARGQIQEVKTFEVYPNPAKSFFVVRGPSSVSNIKIFDVTGKIVKEARSEKQEARISLDGIKSGVYFIKIGNEMIREKLVITK